MTVSSYAMSAFFAGNGTVASFPFAPEFFTPSDLVVYLVNQATGTQVLPNPVLNGSGEYDYQVNGTLDPTILEYLSGGTVVFNNAPPAGYTVMILREVSRLQLTTFNNNTLFPAKAIEQALDRLSMATQQLLEQINRAPSAPIVDDPLGLNYTFPAAAQRANQLVGFDQNGNVITYDPPAGTTVSNVWDVGNPFAGYSIDFSFSPPKIEQWCIVTGTGANQLLTTLKIFFPIAFPNATRGVAITATFTGENGENTGWYVTGTDNQSYISLGFGGLVPGSNIVVYLLLVGD